MSKKIIYGIIAVIVIIAIAIGIVFCLKGNEEEITIDLEQLNTTISAKSPFNEMATMDINTEILTSIYEINAEDIEAVVGKAPMMNVHASMYLVIKAKEGSVDVVKEKVENYASVQEEMWSTYLPAQYELVKARKQGVIGNYVYLFISENSAELEALLK